MLTVGKGLETSETVEIWEEKPERCRRSGYIWYRDKVCRSKRISFSVVDFKKIYGFTPRKESCKSYIFLMKEAS